MADDVTTLATVDFSGWTVGDLDDGFVKDGATIKDNSNKASIASDGTQNCLTFSSNGSYGTCIAIPISGIKERFTVSIVGGEGGVDTAKKFNIGYETNTNTINTATSGALANVFKSSGAAVGIAGSDEVPCAYDKAVVYITRVGSGSTHIRSITITTPKTYSVTYKAGRGTGSDVAVETTKIATSSFTAPTGETFLKWTTNENGTGDSYYPGQIVTSNLTLYAQYAYQVFSLSNITAITKSTEKNKIGSVTATISDGSSVEVFNNKGDADELFYNNSINLNGSGGNYIHITFPTKLVQGDVISAAFLSTTNTWKIGTQANNNQASSKTNPYTLTENDAFIGATELYIFKDAAAQITSITIMGDKQLSDLAVSSSATPTVAIGATSNISYTTSSKGAVTCTSSDTDVATVSNSGVITGVDGGEATITIEQAADATYRAGVQTVTVTVPAVDLIKVKILGGTSAKVTGTVGGTADVKTQNDKKFGSGSYAGFTLAGENTLQTGDVLNVKVTTAATGSGSITVYDSDKTTVLYDTEERGVVGDNKFVLPAAVNGKQTIYICRTNDNGWNAFVDFISVTRPDAVVTLNASGFATFSYGEDFNFLGMADAKAYKMTLNEETKAIVGTEIPASTKIKAGEGILFKGGAGEPFAITATTGATALQDNDLKGSTKSDGTTADKPTYCYVLSGDTFKSYTGATLSPNKAYFEASKDLAANARAFTITFDDVEITAISGVEAKKFVENNKFYNLKGQQVAQPTRGMYIVNGKKVVIK